MLRKLSLVSCCGMDVIQLLLLTLYITLFGDRNIFNTRKLSRKLTKLCIRI